MIYSANFLDLAEKINPFAFCRYLKDTSWTQFKSKRTTVNIYQLELGTEFFQVIIPIDKRLSDYTQAIYKAVKTLYLRQKRSL